MLKALRWSTGELVTADSPPQGDDDVCPRCLSQVERVSGAAEGAYFVHRSSAPCELSKGGPLALGAVDVPEEAFRPLIDDRWELGPAPPPWERMRMWSPAEAPASVDFHREWPRSGAKWYERPFLFRSASFGGRRFEPGAVLFGKQTVYVVYPRSLWSSPFCAELMQTGLARRLADVREMGAIALDIPPSPPEALCQLLQQRLGRFGITIDPGYVIEAGDASQTWLFARRSERAHYHVAVVSASSPDMLRPSATIFVEAPSASLFIKTMERSAVASLAAREEVIAGARHDEIVEHALPALSMQLAFDRGAAPRAFFRVEAPSSTIVPSMTQVVRRRDGLFGCRYQVMLRNYRKEPWAVAYVSLWTEREPSQWERHRSDAEG